MSNVYVIHHPDDRVFVERLLEVLPSNGYDTIANAVDDAALVLAVMSPKAARSKAVAGEIGQAMKSERPMIMIQTPGFEPKDAPDLPDALWAAPAIDLTLETEKEAERLLVSMLPPIDDWTAPGEGQRIEWNEEVFSAALAEAAKRHDHARAEALVAALVRHIAGRPYAYPPKQSANDLQELRQERAFELMRRYGEAVLQSGTRDAKLHRLYAQSLIELKEYARALEVLQAIIKDDDASQGEVYEAYGLVGRTNKQRYVESGDADLIRNAIAAYVAVYDFKPDRLWHGVNAASCILRAHRDGVADAPPVSRAGEIASEIVEELDRRATSGSLQVWDCATKVEALLALDRYDEAEAALGDYIHHPDMRAFEVSSTYRQFDQVLQLGSDSRGEAILQGLRSAVERYRAGKLGTGAAAAPDAALASLTPPELVPLIIRVGDTVWEPSNVPDLTIQTRLGKVITARGSDATVRELLMDPAVISIEESRPAGSIECARSVPFIKCADEYVSAAGKYKETGDAALIAVIDNGIDVLHEAFLGTDGTSRILGVWDQNDPAGPPPKNFTYGTFHDAAAIAQALKDKKGPGNLGRNVDGHGTHVASIAAGRKAGMFAGGVAPDAKLLIVVSAGGGSIGYSQSHIEALAFIDAFAAEQKLPVVVNVSQGMNAGAHDGKSSLEVAFDAFSDSGRRPGRVVVKSAGNERAKNGHALVTIGPGSSEELTWRRVNGAAKTERIEVWWSSGDEVTFRLRNPFKEWTAPVGVTAPELSGTFAKGGSYHLLFTKRHIDNGDSQLLIELGDATAAAGMGEWVLEITGGVVPEGGRLHAWIERTQGAVTSFVDHIDEELTLSIPGTASSVIAVGAVDASNPLKVGKFSSYGPTRDERKMPLVCAPGVDVVAARGGTDSDAFPDSGTSMAAPHVAGAIALLLSKMKKSGGKIAGGNQIASALRTRTQNYNGRWDRGQGYGVIDVAALLGAF